MEKTSKCTPGRWQAKLENDYMPAQVFADDYGQPIADVFGNSREERAANALLIAAAPELLAALKDVVNYFWNAECNPPILKEGDVQSLVEAAIAKAEGRT